MNIFSKLHASFLHDYYFLRTKKLSFSGKIQFLLQKYVRFVIKKQTIFYFGNILSYDNPHTPTLLELYPNEVEVMAQYIPMKNVKKVMDIGANIGQWASTVLAYFPKATVFSFEPNSHIYPLLAQNSTYHRSWKTFNFGIGKSKPKNFLYFTKDHSATGTTIPNKNKDITKIKATILPLNKNTLTKYRLPSHVDLLKIDVEGAEVEALEALKSLTYTYLYIEVSLGRTEGARIEDIMSILKKQGKRPVLKYLHSVGKNAPAGNAIIELTH